MNSIFEYLDYRLYLKDFYENRKQQNSFFSYRVFGTKIGIDPSYLAKVLLQSRHLSINSIPKVADYCGLRDKEAEYFESMVHFVKAKSTKQSKLVFEKMLTLKSFHSEQLMVKQYEFYNKWYYSAVRSVLEYYPFNGNFRELGEMLSPPISKKEAKDSIELLLNLNLISKAESGQYLLTNHAVSTGPQWQSLAIQKFQEETIRLSHESLQRHSKNHRDVSTITMNINADDFIEIKNRIAEFRNFLIKHINEMSSPDRTYQLNIQFFPLSNPNRKEK